MKYKLWRYMMGQNQNKIYLSIWIISVDGSRCGVVRNWFWGVQIYIFPKKNLTIVITISKLQLLIRV